MVELRIENPCHEDWEAMTPTARGRHCASCRKEVLDLTALPAREGRERMREVATRAEREHVCVRGEGDGRGRVLTPAHRRLLTNAFAGLMAMAVAGCSGVGPQLGPTHADPTPAEQPVGERASETRTEADQRAVEQPPETIVPIEPVERTGQIMGAVPRTRVIHRYQGGVRAAPKPEQQAQDLVEPRGNG